MSAIAITFIQNDGKYLLIKNAKSDSWSFHSVFFRAMNTYFSYQEYIKGITDVLEIPLKELALDYLTDIEEETEKKLPYTFLFKAKLSDSGKLLLSKNENTKTVFRWFSFEEICQLSSTNLDSFIKGEVQKIDPLLEDEKYSQSFIQPPKNFEQKHVHYTKYLESVHKPIEFDNNFLASVERIIEARSQGKLVIFAGAGISINSDVPLWSNLIKELKGDMTLEYDESDYLVIAQQYFNERLENEYHKKIRKVLKFKKVIFNKIHEEILKLNPLHIVTTNYDDLFEQAITEDSQPFSIIKKDNDLPFAESNNLLIKMHGDFEEKNIVLKEDDYLNYQSNFPLIESFVRGLFASKVVLFVGFSFTDINLKYIVQRVRNILKDDFQPAYVFFTNEISNQHRAYLKSKGLIALSYTNSIKDYLKSRGEFENIFTKEKERGQKTLDFIKFIQHFDSFVERNRGVHILDQMYNSLKRFDELGSIPPKTLAKLFPFSPFEYIFAKANQVDDFAKDKKEDNGNSSYFKLNSAECTSGYHLETRNEEIIRFISRIPIKNQGLSISKSNKELYKQQHKVEYIFRKLNLSSVFCIKRKGDNSESAHNRILLKNHGNCRCVRCLYSKLEFNLLLEKIEGLTPELLSSSHLSNQELIGPYLFFKLGKIQESYFALKKISSSAWKEEKYITYFIAKYNIKLLRSSIYSFFSSPNLSEKQKSKILKEIDDIDLDSILQKLPVDKVVKGVLTKIKNREAILSINHKTKKLLNEIHKAYEMYKDKRSVRMGYSEVNALIEEIVGLNIFYKGNFLFDDEFREFEEIILVAWEGLILSLMTDGRYQNKLEKFDFYFYSLAIFHTPSKGLFELLKKYNPSNLPVLDGHLEKLIDYINSFFQSNHTKSYSSKNELFFQYRENSERFKQKIKNICQNLLLLLSYTDIKAEQGTNLGKSINLIIKFFEFEPHINNSKDYLLLFFKKKINFFNDQAINKFLKLILSKKPFHERNINKAFQIIATEKKDFIIENQSLNKQVILLLSDGKKFDDILNIYQFVNLEIKTKIRKEVYKRLNVYELGMNKFELYENAILYGIIKIDYNENMLAYLKNIEKRFDEARKIKFDNEGRPLPVPPRSSFITWNSLVVFLNIFYDKELDYKEISKAINLNESPLFLQWALSPEKFDYTKFNPIWLISFDHIEVLLKRMKLVKNKAFHEKVKSFLKENYNAEVAKVYFEKVL